MRPRHRRPSDRGGHGPLFGGGPACLRRGGGVRGPVGYRRRSPRDHGRLKRMLEVELKSVVDDVPRRRAMVERAGGTLAWAGRLLDRRYDTTTRTLAQRDHVLRLRVYHDAASARAELDWKGPTGHDNGYK